MKNWLKLRLPVAARLDGVDSTYADAKLPGKFATTCPRIQKKADKNDVPLIQQCSSILRSFVGSMRHAVVNIFVRRSVAKIAGCVVVSVPVHVADNHSARPWPQESFGDNNVNVLRCLRFVVGPFFEAYRKVRCGGAWLTNKSLSILDRCNAAKVADFVSVMLYHGQPNLKGIRHG